MKTCRDLNHGKKTEVFNLRMGNARVRCGFLVVTAIVLSVCYAQNSTDADNLINTLESQVMQLSRNAVTNFMSSCELLASCHGNCSRHACTPVQADEGYVCKFANNNKYCFNTDGTLGCQKIRFSLTKSFVRLMTPPNNLTSEEKAIICSQRMLDATLKNISLSPTTINSTRAYYAVYFGSIEGVQRYFPGLVRPHSKISEIIFS